MSIAGSMIDVELRGMKFRVNPEKTLVKGLHYSEKFGDKHYLTMWKMEDGEPYPLIREVLVRVP